ncbi:MAG: protein-export chaperone SecB [Methylophilaceae bacterium]|nr:protein-export chaperone SecB [Methylophilaceae bacterium]
MAEENQVAQENQTQEQQPGFGIEKVYVKDASLEIPNAPQVFTWRDAPQINIELNSAAQKVDEAIFDVTLTVTVTSKVGENTAFLVQVAQAGIFQLRNIPESDLGMILGIACPNILFPYAREAVSDLVVRAGFPPVILSPVNFEALYAQQAQQQAAATTPDGVTTH